MLLLTRLSSRGLSIVTRSSLQRISILLSVVVSCQLMYLVDSHWRLQSGSICVTRCWSILSGHVYVAHRWSLQSESICITRRLSILSESITVALCWSLQSGSIRAARRWSGRDLPLDRAQTVTPMRLSNTCSRSRCIIALGTDESDVTSESETVVRFRVQKIHFHPLVQTPEARRREVRSGEGERDASDLQVLGFIHNSHLRGLR